MNELYSENERPELVVSYDENINFGIEAQVKTNKKLRILITLGVALCMVILILMTIKNNANNYWVYLINLILIPFLAFSAVNEMLNGRTKRNVKVVLSIIFMSIMILSSIEAFKQFKKDSFFIRVSVSVPDMKTWNVDKINSWISKNKLTGVTVEYISDNKVTANTFVKFDREVGSITTSEKLIIFVAAKPKVKNVTLINLKGKNVEEAKTWITNNKLKYNIEFVEGSTATSNTVLSQDIVEGKQAAEGTEIKLQVSKTLNQIAVINLTGYKFEDAKKWITDNSLKFSIQYVETGNASQANTISKNSLTDKTVQKGTVVALYVYKYKASTTGTTSTAGTTSRGTSSGNSNLVQTPTDNQVDNSAQSVNEAIPSVETVPADGGTGAEEQVTPAEETGSTP